MRKHFSVALAVTSLVIVFLWIYGRFAGKLYFVLDDPIETQTALSAPLPQAIADSFNGQINWSGYRPVSYAIRATLAHLFKLDMMAGYYLASLGLHLADTLLLFALLQRLWKQIGWAFLVAMIFLLLPSHNEAVLYMSANANLLALFFVLLSLHLALGVEARNNLLLVAASAVAYLLAVLAYEVVLPLPLFVLLIDWQRGFRLRRRLGLYAGFAAAVVIALGLRFWASGGGLTPTRSDYAVSFAPLHLLRGYTILLGQMVLLHTSAWINLPLFVNVREWMSPLNPRALVSMVLTGGAAIACLIVSLRGELAPAIADADGSDTRSSDRASLFWVGWGLLWLVAMSLLFAALAGRNPENRYTYIPSLGFAVALTAVIAWLYAKLVRWPIPRSLWLGLVVLLLTFYAYVDTSDVSAWERASLHTRTFMQGARTNLPTLPANTVITQVGVPGDVGNAYVFTTAESFHAAMQMIYGADLQQTIAGDMELARALRNDPALVARAVLFAYDRTGHKVHLADRALLCDQALTCTDHRFRDGPLHDERWSYLQVYNDALVEQGGLGLIFAPQSDTAPSELVSCWAFYDLQRVRIDPTQHDNAAMTARCQQTAAEVLAADLLEQDGTE